jgi:segregation and condensation protein A
LPACDPRTGAVRTEVFDGPLELLLFLVRKDGVDLREVSIAPITDAFLAQLDLMEALDLDVAADFLVMASTLCWLKSRELLPRRPALDMDEDDEVDAVKAELHRRLMEYQRYREAAEALESRALLGRETFTRRQPPVRGSDRPIEPGIDALGLLELFYGVLQRQAAPPQAHAVEREPVRIEDMANWLLDRVDVGPRDLGDLLRMLRRPEERVAAFLAALEMARLGMIDVSQDEHLGPVHVVGLGTRDAIDLRLLTGGAG